MSVFAVDSQLQQLQGHYIATTSTCIGSHTSRQAVGALQYQDLDHWLRSRLPLPINNTQNVETQDERLLYTFRSRSVSVRKFIIFSYADSQFVLKCSPFIWVSEFLCVWKLKGLIVSFSTMSELTFLNITKPKQCKQYPKAETQLDFQTT